MDKTIYSTRYQLLCKILRDQRRMNDLTQAEVARRMGKPQSFVAKYERGERRLDIIELLAIAEVINIEPIAIIRTLQSVSD